MATLHIVDGTGYVYRAFYAIRPLSTRDGTPTNAVIGFARMFARLLRTERPQLLAMTFDPRGKTFRHEIYPAYKENREATPEDLVPQFALCRELVTALNIPILEQPGWEADDVIATLTVAARELGHDVVIVSADKDLLQLVGDGVQMLDPMKEQRFDAAAVEEKWGVPPEHMVDLLALAGDSSDNIPGVPKVGKKSAQKLITAFGDVEQVIAGLTAHESHGKLKAYERSVLEHVDDARLSKELVILDTKVPVELDTEALRYGAPDAGALGDFLHKIEAYALLRELGVGPEPDAAPAPVAAPRVAAALAVPRPPSPVIDRDAYITILSADDLDRLLAAARKAGALCIAPLDSGGDPRNAELVGLGIAVPGGSAAYVPLTHRTLGVPKQLGREEVLAALEPLLTDPQLKKIGYRIKHLYGLLAANGIILRGIVDDAVLAAYVLDPSRASFTLDSLAREVLEHQTIGEKDLVGTGRKKLRFDQVTVEETTRFAAERAEVAIHLCARLGDEIGSAGLINLYREIELPLLPVLAEMERCGIRVNIGELEALSVELGKRLVAIQERAHREAGREFNLGSTKQLGQILFDELGLPVIKRTKTGPSTDHEVLEALARDHELPRIILEHRELSKLRSTYVEALIKEADPESERVHTTFNQVGTATGRLSSVDPNLQNIPIRTEEGRRIRAVFIAKDGWELISADYSQIELRVMAHLSGDRSFIDAFERGEDIHRRTAMEVLTDGDEPTAETRRQAKAINFGILYGLSAFGLSRTLGIGNAEAKTYIGRYFSRYPAIRGFLDRTIEEAKSRGFVTTLSGRRRFLPDINSRNRTVRQASERIAMNTPIQGSAADLIKIAMVRVAQKLRSRRLEARLLLQVHDELVLEAPRKEREEVVDIVREEMSQVMKLAVPLVVDVGWGDSWVTAH